MVAPLLSSLESLLTVPKEEPLFDEEFDDEFLASIEMVLLFFYFEG